MFGNVSDQEFEDLLAKTCLAAKGQSRIHFRQNRYLVSFESVIQRDVGAWYVGLDVPGRGQEVVQVNYRDDDPHVEGRFYERLYDQAVSESDEVVMWLEEFVELLIFIPHLLDEQNLQALECSNGECQLAERRFYYQVTRHGVTLNLPSSREGLSLVFEISDIDEQREWFKRVNFRLQLTDRAGPDANPAELHLFLSECREV